MLLCKYRYNETNFYLRMHATGQHKSKNMQNHKHPP